MENELMEKLENYFNLLFGNLIYVNFVINKELNSFEVYFVGIYMYIIQYEFLFLKESFDVKDSFSY